MPPYAQSLCGCCEDTTQCCDTICCPCYQVGHQFGAIQGRPHSNSGGECFCSYCCFWSMPIYISCIRCKVSAKHQLGEGCCLSTIIGFCCPSCSLCQTGRELNYHGTNPGGCICTPMDMAPSLNDQLMEIKNDIRSSNVNNNASNVVVNVESPPGSPQGYPPQQQQVAYYPQSPAPMGNEQQQPPAQGYPLQQYPSQVYYVAPQGYPPQQQQYYMDPNTNQPVPIMMMVPPTQQQQQPPSSPHPPIAEQQGSSCAAAPYTPSDNAAGAA